MVAFEKVDKDSLPVLAAMADTVWHEFFPCILTAGQIDYMVEKFQSQAAIEKQIEDGYIYYFILDEGERIGYMGVQPKNGKLFLSKLYILEPYRKKGYAGKAFAFLVDYCREHGLKSIWLTVNRHNDHAVGVYKKKGFTAVREQKTDIGNGYIMDDFVMELKV